MKHRLSISILAVATLAAGGARAADTGGTTGTDPGPLTASDFTLTVSRSSGNGASASFVLLTDDALESYFGVTRCLCPTSVSVELALKSGSASKLASGHTLSATIEVGNDCNDNDVTSCKSIGGTLTLAAARTSSTATLQTADVFAVVVGGPSCAGLTSKRTRLWAIVRDEGDLIGGHPSLAIAVGGAGPQPPRAVKAETADSGLLVSWTASPDDDGTTDSFAGYQVLCLPGRAPPVPAAEWDTCPDATAGAGGSGGGLGSLDDALVCSELVRPGATAARVHGLTNGTAYDVAVIAIRSDRTPSAPSAVASATPGPTLGFGELYDGSGGEADLAGGCEIGGGDRGGRGLAAGAALLAGALAIALRARARRRRWRRRWRWRPPRRGGGLWLPLAAAGAGLCAHAPARAADATPPALVLADDRPSAPPVFVSQRRWNVELRFGPYRPAIDSEFADRGEPARPYAETFSSARHLMMQIEVDRQLLHRGGTLAVGLGAGRYRVSARALSADRLTRTGDETALRLIPLALSAVFRADTLYQSTGFPVVPYAKVGLDCAFWSISHTAREESQDGRTLGWHAAAGVSLDLGFVDPDAALLLDQDAGVNQTAVFFEVAHAALDGFGAPALHVGDTTWLAGLMLEL